VPLPASTSDGDTYFMCFSVQAKRLMGRVLQLASFSLAEVTYATGGEIGFQVQESVRQASYTVRAKSENVSGVMLPAFEGVRSKEGNGMFCERIRRLVD
jgi:vacuolar-type H+-ATPase subunit D/Vma8